MGLKAAVLILGVLATTKVATHEYLYRLGTKDVLVATYRDQAIAACQKEPRSSGSAVSAAWSRPAEIRLIIGKGDISVWFWQVDNDLWEARYRNPYLHLMSSDRAGNLWCEYDIVNGVANVRRT